MTGRSRAAIAFLALAAAALALFAAPGRAQTLRPTDDPDAIVEYGDDVIGYHKVRERERRARVADLQELLAQLDAGRLVILTTGADRTVVATDRLPKMAVWLVSNGKATPAEAAAWVDLQKADSRSATERLRRELQALQRVGAVLAPAPGEDQFPSPMSWYEVRGQARGTYEIRCRRGNDALPPLKGNFTLEFIGDGTVRGIYESDRHQYQVNGEIVREHFAGREADIRGQGAWSMGSLEWGADWDSRVRREGNRIVLAVTAGIRLRPAGDTVCEPGTLVQTD